MTLLAEELNREYQKLEDNFDDLKKDYKEIQRLKDEEWQLQKQLRVQQEQLLETYQKSDAFRLLNSLSEEVATENRTILKDLEQQELDLKKEMKNCEELLERNREEYYKVQNTDD